ncbi:hypothetical protein ACQW5G_01170 [Fructilactobacillus sp. Tb1]|uniref:hypothetical protein n=1 Tax=Fructilactobacillus sp. Tb1 TaxID=3422304 RepID=UPI003D2C4EB9
MVYKAPEQALFDALFKESMALQYPTYDHLPLGTEQATYPFVNIGEVQFVPMVTVDSIQGSLSLTVHIWGDGKQRKRVSDMMNTLFLYAVNLENVGDYRVQFHYQASTTRLLDDTSVPNSILKHGILELEFRLLGGH